MDRNRKRIIRRLYCPLINTVVVVDGFCDDCPYWNGEKCRRTAARGRRTVRKRNRERFTRPRVGRGVRVPSVWEKWPRPGYGGESPKMSGGENKITDYGVPENKEEMEKPGRKPAGEYDPDYHDPFVIDNPEVPGVPEVEVINDKSESTLVPKATASPDVEARNPFDDPFPKLPEGLPELRNPFDELPGQPGPDIEPDIPKPGGNVG